MLHSYRSLNSIKEAFKVKGKDSTNENRMIGAQKPSSLSYASKRLLDQPTDSSYGAVPKYEKRAPESLTGITEKASYASIQRALIVKSVLGF